MILNVQILHTDLTVENRRVVVSRYRKIANALPVVGSRLRAEDPTVAAIRAAGMGRCTWIGHLTPEQFEAVRAKESCEW